MTDIPADASTAASITVGSTFSDSLEIAGDHDWIAVNLDAGEAVEITLNGITLHDPYLYIRDSSGVLLFQNDDISSGVDLNSRVAFSPGYTGTYYIDVGAFADSGAGTYQLSIQPYTPPPAGTIDQIASQLTTGYWNGDTHHFNVSQGGTITVNINSLTAAEQTLARAALSEWSDIIGVHFQEVATGGQIVFDNSEEQSGPIAATDEVWSGGITTSAHVHISSSWVNDYGTSLESYSFQTYVHEIGHALGLGHAGDYNSEARYPYDAMFQNDAWPLSIMSYFSTSDNSSYSFPQNFVLTPMGADIVAMQHLYGLSATTRTGDTVYGFNSNAGGVYNANVYPAASYTIFDDGGTDTLDFSGSSYGQRINLNAETFSSFNGHNLDIYIARGVIIENAIGGTSDDTIVQNSANNVLNGGAGNDTVSYETATSGVTVDLGVTSAQNTGGAGIDTLSGFEHITGSAFADVLIGGPATASLSGGAGNDLIEVGTANQQLSSVGMYGGDGDDVFEIGTAQVWVDGGSGLNTVDCSGASAGMLLSTSGHVGAEVDNLVNIQKIIGSNYADSLYTSAGGDVLIGGGGDDSLTSAGSAYLAGGAGNDTYVVSNSTDQIIENAGEGIDTVLARGNYVLGANLENLTFREIAGLAVPPQTEDWSGTGNELANVITGNAGANFLVGQGGADTLTGGAGNDTITGGTGNDTFIDTAAGLNGDTITDFGQGDRLLFSDASLANFNFSLAGHTLSFTGGTLTLSTSPGGRLMASAAGANGVQLTVVSATHFDFNGDGLSDVLWRNQAGTLQEWLGQSNGSFTYNAAALYQMPTTLHVAAAGDFNGDGRIDVIWRGDAGGAQEWLANANGSFSFNSSAVYQMPTTTQIAETGDFNGDGRSDILWLDASGNVQEWIASTSGDGTFTPNAAAAPSLAAGNHIVGTGDYNGDGHDDVLIHADNGTTSIWLANADGTFAVSVATYQMPSNWAVAGAGDFNGDGRADILWQNGNTGSTIEWLGQANGSFAFNGAANNGLDLTWHVAETGDFNGDGRDDVLWRNDSGTATTWISQADGSFHHSAATYAMPTNWHLQSPPDHFV